MNEKFFSESFDIEILVLPSKEGCFLEILGIAIGCITVASTAINQTSQFLNTPIGLKTFQRVFGTEHAPEWFIENIGKKEVGKKIVKTVAEISETKTEELEEKGMKIKEFPKVYSGRSQIFQACRNNKSVQGIEFCKKDNNFIVREDFRDFITKSEEKNLPPQYKYHKLRTLNAAINKPIKGKGQPPKQFWQGQDVENKKFRKFVLEDDDFFYRFIDGSYPLDEAGNIMIAKFRYDEVEVDGKIDPKKTEIFATEVYYFNKEIKKYPDDLNIVLVGESGVVKNEQKPDLFDCLIKKSLSTN